MIIIFQNIIYCQKSDVIVSSYNEQKEVTEWYNDCYKGILLDSLNINRIIDTVSYIKEDFFFTDRYDLDGMVQSNVLFDAIICNNGFIFLNQEIYSNILGNNFIDEIFNSIKKNKILSVKNLDTIIKYYQQANNRVYIKITSASMAFLLGGKIKPMYFNISCNTNFTLVKLKYKYIDFNAYVLTRVPVLLNCIDYKKYNEYIYKKYSYYSAGLIHNNRIS